MKFDTASKKKYLESRNSLKEKFNYKSDYQIPKILSVILSECNGKGDLESSRKSITEIAGQKAIVTEARKHISQFSLRKGKKIGVKVTLRGDIMWNFLDHLWHSLTNWRSFEGFNEKSINIQGDKVSFNLGIRDKRYFLINYKSPSGLSKEGFMVTFNTTAKNKEEFIHLVEGIGFPVKRSLNG